MAADLAIRNYFFRNSANELLAMGPTRALADRFWRESGKTIDPGRSVRDGGCWRYVRGMKKPVI